MYINKIQSSGPFEKTYFVDMFLAPQVLDKGLRVPHISFIAAVTRKLIRVEMLKVSVEVVGRYAFHFDLGPIIL